MGLARELVGREFGVLEAWGRALVRPFDELWTLRSAEARGERLHLRFANASGNSAVLLSVDAPAGASLEADGLTVARARSVRWPGVSAVVAGRRLRFKTNGEPSEEALPAGPALRLGWAR